jgi:hypothetical protein
MSNIIRFVTSNYRSKENKIDNKTSGCEIIILPVIQYCRSENPAFSDKKVTGRSKPSSKPATAKPSVGGRRKRRVTRASA